jgi:hypothetical protein
MRLVSIKVCKNKRKWETKHTLPSVQILKKAKMLQEETVTHPIKKIWRKRDEHIGRNSTSSIQRKWKLSKIQCPVNIYRKMLFSYKTWVRYQGEQRENMSSYKLTIFLTQAKREVLGKISVERFKDEMIQLINSRIPFLYSLKANYTS